MDEKAAQLTALVNNLEHLRQSQDVLSVALKAVVRDLKAIEAAGEAGDARRCVELARCVAQNLTESLVKVRNEHLAIKIGKE